MGALSRRLLSTWRGCKKNMRMAGPASGAELAGRAGRPLECKSLTATAAGARGSRGISAGPRVGPSPWFSSTTFSGMRSMGRGSTQAAGPEAWGLPRPSFCSHDPRPWPPQADLPLTLVLDEAVGSQELQ